MFKTRLRKIAEWQKLEDGTYLDTDTGEVTDMPPKDQDGVVWKEEIPIAQSKYPSNDYQNQWGKVSPFNIIMKDMIGQLYGLTPAMIADTVCAFIESMNNEFGAMDKTYDYVSQNYLRELRYNLEKCRTSEKAIDYLTNIYFKGMGMGGSNRKNASSNNGLDKKQKAALGLFINAMYDLDKKAINDNEFQKNIHEVLINHCNKILK